jgi:hypothetical protein
LRKWKTEKLELDYFQKQKSLKSYRTIVKKSKAGGVRVRQFSKNQKLAELEFFPKAESK